MLPSVCSCHASFGLPWQVTAVTLAPEWTPPPDAASRHSDIDTKVVGLETVGVGVGVGVLGGADGMVDAEVDGAAPAGVIATELVAVGTPGTVELLVSVRCQGCAMPSAMEPTRTTAATEPPTIRIFRRAAAASSMSSA